MKRMTRRKEQVRSAVNVGRMMEMDNRLENKKL